MINEKGKKWREEMHFDIEAKKREKQEKNAQERYHSKAYREYRVKRAKKMKMKRLAGKIGTSMLATILAGGIAYGSVETYKRHKAKENAVTIEEAKRMGETAQSLGIELYTQTQIQEFKNQVRRASTDEQLNALGYDISDLELNTLKLKIANAVGCDKDDVLVYVPNNKEDEPIFKIDNEQYLDDNIFNMFEENRYSENIKKAMEEVADIQTSLTHGLKGKKGKDTLEESLKRTEAISTAKVYKNEKGEIELDYRTKADLEKEHKEEQQAKEEEDLEL